MKTIQELEKYKKSQFFEKYEVFDLERGDDSIITDYQDIYGWEWSTHYYNHLKAVIDSFMNQKK